MSSRAAFAALAFSCCVAGIASAQASVGFRDGQQETKVVERFDTDGDNRLDAAERRAAREGLRAAPERPARRPRAATAAGAFLTPADVTAYPASVPVYDANTVRTMFLEFEGPDWEQELSAFYRTDVDVPATMMVDGKTYREVGVHFRGNSSFRMVGAGFKRSLNLTLDFVHDRQDFGGYDSFNLLNANADPTFVRPLLYSEIARQYIPISKVNFVRVVINGESWGIYVSSQQVDKDFLAEWFSTRDGARWRAPGSPRGRAGLEYLGESIAPYRHLYDIKTKDDGYAWADFIRLCKVLNDTPPDALEAALAPLLDVDGVLRFLALDVALVNGDGYWARASDYNIYQHPAGRFHIIPHDFNEALGSEAGRGFGPGRGGPELDPFVGVRDAAKPLRSKLLAVPALRARYLAYVREIAEKWLDWNTLGPIAEKYQALIAADIKADTRKLYSFDEFRTGLTGRDGLKQFVDRRRAYLLAATAPQPQEQAQAQPPGPPRQIFVPEVGQAGKDVVWVPTPPELVDKMLDLANVTSRDFVIDLGSGDGRTVIAAARRGARALGVEFNPDMVALSRRNAAAAGLADKATFVHGDMFEADVSQATVLALFLLPGNMLQLRDKFLNLAPGTRIVANTFGIQDWSPDETASIGDTCTAWCRALLWIVPAKVAGTWRLPGGDLTLAQEYQAVSGTLGGMPLVNGRLRGDLLTFTVGAAEYTARVAGDRLEGTVRNSGTETAFVGVR